MLFHFIKISSALDYETMNKYREILTANNIKCRVKMKTIGSMHPMDQAVIGTLGMNKIKRVYSLYVDKKDAEMALHLIKSV